MFGASLLLTAASSPVEECPRDGSQHLRHGECEDFVPPYLCRKNFRHVSSSTDRKCCICGAGSVRCCVLAASVDQSVGIACRVGRLLQCFPHHGFGPGCYLRISGFSWFSDWNPKVQKYVNIVDLVKRFHTSR